MLYSLVEPSGKLQLTGSDWDLAENYFDERKVRDADLGGAGDWSSWSQEFDLACISPYCSSMIL